MKTPKNKPAPSTPSAKMGAEIKTIRKSLAMNQGRLSGLLGITQTTLSLVERGGVNEIVTTNLLKQTKEIQRKLAKNEIVRPVPDQKTTDAEQLQCWRWLADTKNFACSRPYYDNDNCLAGYTLTWYVKDFGWCSAQGPTLELAVKSAQATVIKGTEHWPGVIREDGSVVPYQEKVQGPESTVFFSGVTESERGWGTRPEGHLIALTLEQFNKRAMEIKAAGNIDLYSTVNGPALRCVVTPEMMQRLQASADGTIWVDKGTEWFVREIKDGN